ncbi:MAG: hypothetical protein ACFWTZ_06770 [Burkholderia sp.]|jgi:hypothetical protein
MPAFLQAVLNKSSKTLVLGPFLQKKGRLLWIDRLCHRDLPKDSVWRTWLELFRKLGIKTERVEREIASRRFPVVSRCLCPPPDDDPDWLDAWKPSPEGDDVTCRDTADLEETRSLLEKSSKELVSFFKLEGRGNLNETVRYEVRIKPDEKDLGFTKEEAEILKSLKVDAGTFYAVPSGDETSEIYLSRKGALHSYCSTSVEHYRRILDIDPNAQAALGLRVIDGDRPGSDLCYVTMGVPVERANKIAKHFGWNISFVVVEDEKRKL